MTRDLKHNYLNAICSLEAVSVANIEYLHNVLGKEMVHSKQKHLQWKTRTGVGIIHMSQVPLVRVLPEHMFLLLWLSKQCTLNALGHVPVSCICSFWLCSSDKKRVLTEGQLVALLCCPALM